MEVPPKRKPPSEVAIIEEIPSMELLPKILSQTCVGLAPGVSSIGSILPFVPSQPVASVNRARKNVTSGFERHFVYHEINYLEMNIAQKRSKST